jgi:hypothetical protein
MVNLAMVMMLVGAFEGAPVALKLGLAVGLAVGRVDNVGLNVVGETLGL